MTLYLENTIYTKLIAIMAEVPRVEKRPASGLPYPFVSHDDVTMILGPLLIKHKVVVLPSVIDRSWNGNRCSLSVRLTFVDAEHPGNNCTIESVGDGQGNTDKEAGKAYSYAVKMALLKVFFMHTGERDNETVDAPHAVLEVGVVRQALKLLTDKDAMGFHALTHEMSDDEKMALWKEFNVKAKAGARELLNEARKLMEPITAAKD